MKIVADIGLRGIDKILPLMNGLEFFDINLLETNEITSYAIKETDILLIRSQTKIDRLLLSGSNIKWIGSATAGIDHIDKQYLKDNGIGWFNASGCNSLSVCNYVLSCLYVLSSNGLFKKNDTVGILGFGNIGSKLKKILDNLGINNCAYDPFIRNKYLSEIDDVMNCELLTIHTPLTFEGQFPTQNMINKRYLSLTKSHSIINTSRGGIVDEKRVLDSHINYIADVWENEPNPHIASIEKSYIATPHIAGHSQEGKLNGTIAVLIELMNQLNLSKDVMAENIQTLKEYVDKKNNKYKSLKDFYKEYSVITESNNFKRRAHCALNKCVDNFSQIRSDHPERNDLVFFDSQ